MKKIILTVCAFFFVTMLSAQGITTASAYFKTISEYYASLQDYEVDFEITIDKKETAGVLSYKAPELLRLDYSNPKDQVICFNGDLLTVYLPESSAVLMQQVSVENSAAASLASGATGQGLALMSRYYRVAYESGQNAEPLDEGSDEMVVKFILTKKTNAEAFRYIKICVNEATKLIRRVEAVTPKGETFIFNFYEYKINEGISEQRFVYDAPSSANTYNNFLYAE